MDGLVIWALVTKGDLLGLIQGVNQRQIIEFFSSLGSRTQVVGGTKCSVYIHK